MGFSDLVIKQAAQLDKACFVSVSDILTDLKVKSLLALQVDDKNLLKRLKEGESCRHLGELVMAEGIRVPAVKVSLKNEMYPQFNFLRRRLFSIHTRFKAVIEKEEVLDFIPDGRNLMNQIEEAKAKLKDPVCLYIVGAHSSIPTSTIETHFVVSSKVLKADSSTSTSAVRPEFVISPKVPDEFKIIKTELGENEFKDIIDSIKEYPSLIVHVVQTDDNQDKSGLQPFERAAQEMVSLLSPEDHKCCVLCSTSCREYCILDDFSSNGNFSELDSVGAMIQSCLQEKVVNVLKLMVDFLQLFLPAIEQTHNRDALGNTIAKSEQKSIDESNLKEEKAELDNKRNLESGTAEYTSSNTELDICHSLAMKYKVKSRVVEEILHKTKFDEKIKEKGVDRDTILGWSSENLAAFDEQTHRHLTVISDTFKKFRFEINGVFRQANVSLSSARPGNVYVPPDLKTEILRTEGVLGCGLIYDKLMVHVKDSMLYDIKELPEKLRMMMRRIGRPEFIHNFEVQPVHVSSSVGVTYESGKSLRVANAQNTGQASTGDVVYSQSHSYGTLGCFVNGKADVQNSDDYNTQLYALTCAHVFPNGCSNCVEVGRTESEYDMLGVVSPELTMFKEHIIDIAAVLVDDGVLDKCNINLKNCNGCENWKTVLHKGDFSELMGTEVFKWGSASNLTQGMIASIDYEIHPVENLDEQYNILIETLPGSEVDFSSRGDSGTVVCFEVPEEEKIVALSMINAQVLEQSSGKYLCSSSCHLHTNIEQLSKKTNIKFKWCD